MLCILLYGWNFTSYNFINYMAKSLGIASPHVVKSSSFMHLVCQYQP